MATFRDQAEQVSDNRQSQYCKLFQHNYGHICTVSVSSSVIMICTLYIYYIIMTILYTYIVEELQSEFFKDFEVANIVDPERSRKSTASDSSSVASRDS